MTLRSARDVATAAIVGAYLNADMDSFTSMKVTGIMTTVDNTSKKYVTQENGKATLYLQKKALYGCVKSALLWYEFLSTL
jgi:hypothetical protein